MKTLQQRIVQFTGYTRAFVDTLVQAYVEFLRDLVETEPIQRPEQSQKSGHARQTEPSGLVIRRRDGKFQECAGFVPHTVVVARAHAETVVAWSKIAIEGLPAIAASCQPGIPPSSL